jgi:hypothetical protein
MLTKRGWIVLAVAVGVLAGCEVTLDLVSVSPRGLAALGVHDGKPVVLLADCKRYEIVEVKISPTPDPFKRPDDAHGWVLSRPLSAPLPDEVVALGAPPAGWTEQHAGTLTKLAAGQLYDLATWDENDVTSGPGSLTDFDFTVADLNGLAPGQVLVGHDKQFERETEKKFRSGAKQAC